MFTVCAWLKLQFLCHAGETEVGAFGISTSNNSLYVENVAPVKQRCSCVSVEFDDEAVAEFFDQQVDEGKTPDQFARIWLHTHPGDSPTPSSVDEDTFARVFGRCNWAVMFILARGGQIYCRLRVGTRTEERGVQLAASIPVTVDYSQLGTAGIAFPTADWAKEYARNVHAEPLLWSDGLESPNATIRSGEQAVSDECDADAWLACFDELDPIEQGLVRDELSARFDDQQAGEEVEYAD